MILAFPIPFDILAPKLALRGRHVSAQRGRGVRICQVWCVVTRVLRAEIVGFHVDPIRSYYSVCDWGLNQNGWIGLLIKA